MKKPEKTYTCYKFRCGSLREADQLLCKLSELDFEAEVVYSTVFIVVCQVFDDEHKKFSKFVDSNCE